MNLYEYQMSTSFIDLGPRSLRFTFSNLFSLETARPIEAKFHMEPQWDGEMKVYSNDPCDMTNMASMPIYGKNLKNLLLWNQTADDLESWHAAPGTRVLPCLFKCWPWVDLDRFYDRVNFVSECFCMGDSLYSIEC